MNILIVEDEIVVAMDLKKMVEDFGYKVIDIASNDNEVDDLLQTNKIDLILMDINLEDSILNGIEIASKISTPVIYLTAYSDDDTIEKMVQTNPLGYIVKPFKDYELKGNLKLARFKLINYTEGEKKELKDGYYYDYELDQLFYHDILINLGKYEKKLFKLLLDAKGTIVSFDRIDYEIWGGGFVNDSTRRSLIFRLKSKLEHKFISTISGVGCKMELQG
jgi:DNA-binding response OmpR family regulator